jgi:putative flippase GtrA
MSLITSLKKFIASPLFYQIFKFGCIGVLAAIVNFIVVIFLVEKFAWHPLTSNILGFILAFQVSFFGHRHWTFKSANIKNHHVAWAKFFIVAIFSLGLNQASYAFYLFFISHYTLALFLALATVPPITFILSKIWAFK